MCKKKNEEDLPVLYIHIININIYAEYILRNNKDELHSS